MVIVTSIKKRKIQLFGRLGINSLRKICKVEQISSSGKKDEIVERLASKLSLKKARVYSKNLGLEEGVSLFKHRLVPKHRIMSGKEKQKLFKKYSITSRNLPRIRVRDPAAMAIGARIGDVIEITRKSPTAGETKYYRVVVKMPIRR